MGSLTFLQSNSSSSNTNSYTFSAQNLGTADADRYIIVCVMSRKGAPATTLDSVTVGGVSATIVNQIWSATGDPNMAGIAIAHVPTGTTGDVVITFGDTMVRIGIGMYSAIGLSSVTENDQGTSTDANPTYDINIPAGGFAVGCANFLYGSTTNWTGLTSDYDISVESSNECTGASDTFVAEQTGLTITADSNSSTYACGAFASWGFGGGGPTLIYTRTLLKVGL